MGGRALNSITAMQTTPGGELCAAWIRGAPHPQEDQESVLDPRTEEKGLD